MKTKRILNVIAAAALAFSFCGVEQVQGTFFTNASSMTTPRASHAAVLLPNNKVLVTGGSDGGSIVSSAELYDPSAGTWVATTAMNIARLSHTATLLPNGKVLVVGGSTMASPYYTASAELYDPAAATWTVMGSMAAMRAGHTATLLPSGKVLVAGGNANGAWLRSAELYDPTTDTWSATGLMTTARSTHTATLLPNGKVLVAGGTGQYDSTAELYDPANGTWTWTGSMLDAGLHDHTATLLANGKVLVAGGTDAMPSYYSSAELYDPATGIWTRTGSMTASRYAHTATLLGSGKVLVAGGLTYSWAGSCLATADLYDPDTGIWTATGSMATPRCYDSATLLSSGKVLIAGGMRVVDAAYQYQATAELYYPATGLNSDPGITNQPVDTTVPYRGTATFSVGVTGTPPFSFQWVKDGTNLSSNARISGTTSNILTISNVQVSDAGDYFVMVTNSVGSAMSEVATLKVTLTFADALNTTGMVWTTGSYNGSWSPEPWFVETATTHDGIAAAQSGAIANNGNSWIQTMVSGPGRLRFWWKVSSEEDDDYLSFYVNNSLGISVRGMSISGDVGWRQEVIYLPDGMNTLTWRYSKDNWGGVGEDAGWLDEVSFQPLPEPTIYSMSGDIVVASGGTATFSASVVGSLPMSYQWYRDGIPLIDGNRISGSRTAVMTITNVVVSDAGHYWLAVSNAYGSTNSASVTLRVLPNVTATQVSRLDLPDPAWSVTVVGTNAYIGSSPLQIVSVANPTAPVLLGKYTNGIGGGEIVLLGNIAYVVEGESGLQIFNVSDPRNPFPVNTLGAFGGFEGIDIAGNVVCLSGLFFGGISTYNLDNPTNPVPVGGLSLGNGGEVAISDSLAYLTSEGEGLKIVDITDPTNIVLRGSCTLRDAVTVAVSGDLACVGALYYDFYTIDVHDPSQPEVIGHYSTISDIMDIKVRGELAYLAGYPGLEVLDLSDPTRPASLCSFSDPSGASGVDVSGNYAYLTDGNGMTIISIHTNSPLVPVLVEQPVGRTILSGDTVALAVGADGALPLCYQWLIGSNALAGATNSLLWLTNVQPSQAGGYSVIVSNFYGSVTSSVAVLTVGLVGADSFNPGADDGVYCVVPQADGKILVGGAFSTLGGQPRDCLARLDSSGTVDMTFNPGADGEVGCFAVQPDGKIIVGGWFSTLGGESHTDLGRLNPDGNVDTAFNPVFDGEFDALALQVDGKILVGGSFETLGGMSCTNIGRLNTNGSVDTTFNPGTDGVVWSLAVQGDGKILVGGSFETLGGMSCTNIGRLNTNGSVDTTFNPGTDGVVWSLAVQADGKVLVGGSFTTLGGQAHNNIGRLNSDGSVDTTFDAGIDADGYVDSFALQADGKILVGGYFSTLGGQPCANIGRLNSDGSVDATFDPQADDEVGSLALQADGKILAGGWFTTLAGQSRANLGRLSNTDPATQSLTFDGSTVSWLRGGTSPEVWRTTFDYSTNGSDWISLGAGTRITGGWQRTGLSLPPNATIRARGFVTGGYDSASSWFVDAYYSTATGTNPPVTVCLLDYYYPIFAGNQWVYDAQGNWDGSPNAMWRVDSVSMPLTCYTGRSPVSTYTQDVVRLYATYGTYNGTSFDPTDEWLEYPIVRGGWGTAGYDDDPGTMEMRLDPVLVLSNCIYLGQAISTNGDVYVNGAYSGTYAYQLEMLGFADVTVPAGTFYSCLHLQYTLSAMGESQTIEEWWARGMGMVRKTVNQSGQSSRLYELRSASFVSPPQITSQPQSRTNSLGTTANFSIQAIGTDPLSCQWRKNGTNLLGGGTLSGATSTNLTVASVQASDAGSYSVVVTNSYGSVTSSVAVLAVVSVPVLTISNYTNGLPQLSFSGTAGTYCDIEKSTNLVNWNYVGRALVGATLDLGLLDPAWRSSPCGFFRVALASSQQDLPPTITSQPVGVEGFAGDSAVFTVAATGSLPLQYQWQLNATNIAGATNFSLVFTNLQTSQAGIYSVIVTNGAGSVTSSNAVLTILTISEQYTYTTNDDSTINITGYIGSGGTVTIPSTINGLPVTSVGDYAFWGCTSLTSITIPNSVTNIGIEAFDGCSSLTSITIPGGVTSIGDIAFQGCTSLTNITIPASVTSIGEWVFNQCSSLSAITVNSNNPAYSSLDGVLFNQSQTALVAYPEGKVGTSYTIPSGVTDIGNSAFASCTSLASVTIPNSVTSLGQWAFMACYSLTNVTIPNSVTSIGGWAFDACSSLSSVTIPDSVTSIGGGTFAGCNCLSAITVNSNNPAYTSIAGVLFNRSQTTLVEYPGGKAGTSYTIPSSVTSIGEEAFSFCLGLTSVTIPNSVTSIGEEAFVACYSLTNVELGNSVASIGGYAFYNCTSLTSITVPNSVTSIGDGVFYYCTSLTNVTIGNNVTSIGDYAFSWCSSLTGVYFQGNAPSFGPFVFYNDNNTTVYYLPGMIDWGSTFGGLPTAQWHLPYPLILSTSPNFGVKTNLFGFTISWATNLAVVVQGCTNLASPTWIPISTNALTSGTSYFSDSKWTNYPGRFYRVRTQ